jgi:hypothetical protein
MNKSSQMSSTNSLRRQPKQERGQQRVVKILTAAAEVFAEVGYAAATTQQIADRAKTAVGSIPGQIGDFPCSRSGAYGTDRDRQHGTSR